MPLVVGEFKQENITKIFSVLLLSSPTHQPPLLNLWKEWSFFYYHFLSSLSVLIDRKDKTFSLLFSLHRIMRDSRSSSWQSTAQVDSRKRKIMWIWSATKLCFFHNKSYLFHRKDRGLTKFVCSNFNTKYILIVDTLFGGLGYFGLVSL